MEDDDKLKMKNIETYTDDIIRVIENDRGGLIKKIIHEEEEHEALKKNLSPGSEKNRLFMFISILFILFGLTVLFFLFIFNKNKDTFTITPPVASAILTDKTDFQTVDGLTKDQIADTLFSQVKNTKIKTGEVGGIYLTENKKVVGFKRFIALLENNLEMNQDGFISDNFLLGVVNKSIPPVDTLVRRTAQKVAGGDFFILLHVRSFIDVFPVMRIWENEMFDNLHGFFGVGISSQNNYLPKKDFEDGVVLNKNARILKDKDGEIVLMYIFVDDSYVVITDSETATEEIILRLFRSQIKK